jgi:hypothetical protein
MTKDKQEYIHVGTEGVIRRCKSKEDRQCNDFMFFCLSFVIFFYFITFSVLFWFTSSDYTFSTYMYVWLFVYSHFSLGHYIVCPLLIYIFCLHLQYLHVCMIVYKTLHRKKHNWTTWSPQRSGGELRCSSRISC